MKLGIMLATLITGASSIALAAPADHAPPYAVRGDGNAYGRWNRGNHQWVTIGSGKLSARGRRMVDVSSARSFETLKLEANGRMFVDKIAITYGNGETQLVQLAKRLGRGDSALTIDLEGRARKIDKIVVFGRGTSAGFELLAK